MSLNDKNKLWVGGTIVCTVVFLITISTTTAKGNFNYYPEKVGSHPPALPVQTCMQTCFADKNCQGTSKCCPTNCGGTICARPVTMQEPTPESTKKPGSCPIPKMQNIDSETKRTTPCSNDNHCPGLQKCCKTLWTIMTCQPIGEGPALR